jgi:Flp pilus assembly protein TadD
MALRGEGRARDAVPILRRASESSPRDVGILNNYGVVLAESGDVAAALAVWHRVLDLDPGNPVARDNLAARSGR